MEPQVFICHSSADAGTAREICDRLEANGVGCWIAPRDPVPGVPYAQQIVSAIAAVRVVLLVFSAHANDSRHVLSEIELAANRGKAVFPVLLEDVPPAPSLEFYIRAIHWFDASSRPLADVWSDLVSDIRSLVEPMTPTVSPTSETPGAAPPPNNLPLQLTSFVGRERTLAEIEQLLKENRLVTIVGSGGAGKTRAAIQAATRVLPAFPDGAWMVELAPISNGALVTGAVARVLDVRESTSSPLLDSLLEHLKRQRLLLVIDNCEQVIDDVRIVANAVLRSCSGVRIIATSRESLNIAGERVFRLPSLSVPTAGELVTAQTARSFGAVSLFADRAAAADERFELTDDNAPIVAEICRRLDGIPLAIELAAARIKVLSPQQLAQKLDERFRVLTGGDRSALPRHQTMRALIDWSYDLLTDDERALFRKLGVFADGFTLQGATAVCGDERCDEFAVLDIISSLVDKSLLQVDPGSAERYRLLESTREYAQEKLHASGEFDRTALRHLHYLTDVFRRAGEEYEATMSGAAVTGLTIELEDARSALDWAMQHVPPEAADLFLATRLWVHLGLHREAIERGRRLVELVDSDDAPRLARLWERIAFCAGGIGHNAMAREAAEKALRYARASNDRGILADCLLWYADVISRFHRFDEALAALDEAEALGLESPRRERQAAHARGIIASIRGDFQTATESFSKVREVYASLGNDVGVVSAALNIAEMDHARGATREAIDIATEELPRAARLSDRSVWALLTRNLAGYLCAAGDVARAREAARDAIAFYATHDPEGPFAAISLEHMALCLALEGSMDAAAQLEGYVENTLTQIGFEREYTERVTHDRLMLLLQQHLSAEDLRALLATGSGMRARQALALGTADGAARVIDPSRS